MLPTRRMPANLRLKKIAGRENITNAILVLLILAGTYRTAYSQVASSATGYETRAADSTKTTSMIYPINQDISFIYDKPRVFQFLGNARKDFAIYCTNTFQKKNALKIGTMVAVTGLLVAPGLNVTVPEPL